MQYYSTTPTTTTIQDTHYMDSIVSDCDKVIQSWKQQHQDLHLTLDLSTFPNPLPVNVINRLKWIAKAIYHSGEEKHSGPSSGMIRMDRLPIQLYDFKVSLIGPEYTNLYMDRLIHGLAKDIGASMFTLNTIPLIGNKGISS